jgi:hypothetical protein
MYSYFIIEKWYSQIQILSEALTVSQAREYSSIDRMFQKELVDPIWDRIVKLGEFTSKRQDRVYFNYTALPSQSEFPGLVHKYGSHVLDLCVYLEMAILLRQSDINFNQISNTEIESKVKDIIMLEPKLRDERFEPEDDSIYLPETRVTWNLKTEMITEPNGKQMKLGKYVEFLLRKYLIPFVNPGLAELNTNLKRAYQKYITRKSQANEPTRAKEFYIVISRHPYDLAGMSTGRGWRSCMNIEDGVNKRFVKCDVEEGAFIAYLVDRNDRNINSPVGRVLIKPYYHEYDNILLYRPEQRVYGTLPKTFREEVVQILEKANAEQNLPAGRYVLKPTLYKDSPDSQVYHIFRTEADKWRILLDGINDLEFFVESFNKYLSYVQKDKPFQDKKTFHRVMDDEDVDTVDTQIKQIQFRYWTFLTELFRIESEDYNNYSYGNLIYPDWYEKRTTPIRQGDDEIDRFAKIFTTVSAASETIEDIINTLDSNLDPSTVQIKVDRLSTVLHKQIDNIQVLLFGDMWFTERPRKENKAE